MTSQAVGLCCDHRDVTIQLIVTVKLTKVGMTASERGTARRHQAEQIRVHHVYNMPCCEREIL